MRILVVEDRFRMAESLQKALKADGHTVSLAHDGLTALNILMNADFEVVVLDVMLPQMDGLQVLRRLRSSGRSVATLLLTARDSEQDIIEGLDSGADDYLTKPFRLKILCARVRALGRRNRDTPQGPALEFHDLVLNSAVRAATRNGRTISLTRTEFALLELLMRNSGLVMSQDKLIEYAWGLGSEIDERTLYVFIANLRRKLNQKGEVRLIETVRGLGYTMSVSSYV